MLDRLHPCEMRMPLQSRARWRALTVRQAYKEEAQIVLCHHRCRAQCRHGARGQAARQVAQAAIREAGADNIVLLLMPEDVLREFAAVDRAARKPTVTFSLTL